MKYEKIYNCKDDAEAAVILGLLIFHHKTRKWKFRILVPVSVVLWAGILCSVLIKYGVKEAYYLE